jgi:hypothetical protein
VLVIENIKEEHFVNKNEEKKDVEFENTMQAVKLFVKEALKEIDTENNRLDFIEKEFGSGTYRILNIYNIKNEYQIVHYKNVKKKEPVELYAAYVDFNFVEKNIETFDLALIKAMAFKYSAPGATPWIARMLEMEQYNKRAREVRNPTIDSVDFNPFSEYPVFSFVDDEESETDTK